jgi:hypothetical protein
MKVVHEDQPDSRGHFLQVVLHVTGPRNVLVVGGGKWAEAYSCCLVDAREAQLTTFEGGGQRQNESSNPISTLYLPAKYISHDVDKEKAETYSEGFNT